MVLSPNEVEALFAGDAQRQVSGDPDDDLLRRTAIAEATHLQLTRYNLIWEGCNSAISAAPTAEVFHARVPDT